MPKITKAELVSYKQLKSWRQWTGTNLYAIMWLMYSVFSLNNVDHMLIMHMNNTYEYAFAKHRDR